MTRKRMPARRPSLSFEFDHEGHRYRATVGFFPDGITPGELFLTTGKINSALQDNATNAAVLVSLLLQHNVSVADILHSISGPIAIALQTFMGDAP